MSIMCIKYYFHFHLSVPLLHATSDYIKSNFFGFRWAKWVVFSLVMQLNMLTDRDNSLSWDFAMCWWNSVVQSTKRFNSVVFLQRLKASYSIHLSQHLSWFLFSSWYTICDEQMVLFVSCNFLVIVRRDQFDVSREYVKLTSHILPNVLRRDYCRLEMLDSMGAFLWDDPDQDQRSEITWIMVDQMNQRILVQNGFIGSFDLPRSEWSRITDPETDHLKGTHPCVLSPLLTVALPLNIRALQWFLPT